MQLKQITKRAAAMVLVLCLLMSLTACSQADMYTAMFSMMGIGMEYFFQGMVGSQLPILPLIERIGVQIFVGTSVGNSDFQQIVFLEILG